MGQYDGIETIMIGKWIRSRFAERAGELDNLTYEGAPMGAISQRIYEEIAPPGAAYPNIVFQCQSPPRDIRGVGLSRVMVDTLYVVKAIAQVNTYDPLAQVAQIIDQVMTATPEAGFEGGYVFSSARNASFKLVEQTDGKQYRHLGGIYSLQAQG